MYKLLIIDDEADIREEIYKSIFALRFEIAGFIKDVGSDETLTLLDDPTIDCIVLDMVRKEDTDNIDPFRLTMQYIGKRKPVILVSRFFNKIASWLNDIRQNEYSIIGYFGWEEFKDITEKKDMAAIISLKIIFSLNNFYGRTQAKKDPNDKITIIQISDLQFGDPTTTPDDELSEVIIADELLKKKYNIKPDLIVVTGDVAYRGLPSEFERAYKWIYKFAKLVLPDKLESLNERILLVPGNHDVNLILNASMAYKYNFDNVEGENFDKHTIGDNLEAPIKLTTSGRGKLTTCFAGEDLVVQVCQC